MKDFWNDEHRGWKINDIEVSPKVFFLMIPIITVVESFGYKAVNRVISESIHAISHLANRR